MKLLKQLGIILAIYVACEAVMAVVPVNFPGSVLGMLVLFVLLSTGVLKLEQIQDVGNFLLSNMTLFFIPAAVVLGAYWTQLADNWASLALICLVGICCVYLATYYTARLTQRLQARKQARG